MNFRGLRSFLFVWREKGGEVLNRRRSLLISLVAAVMAGLLVYGVYVMQVNQVELQQTVQVVVPKDFIRAGVLIREDMVEFRAVQKGSYTAGMMTKLTEVVGQETLIPLR